MGGFSKGWVMSSQKNALLDENTKNELVRDLMSSDAPIGVIIYQDRIVYANDYAKKAFGYPEKELYKIDFTEKIVFGDVDKVEELKVRKPQREYQSHELGILAKNGVLWIRGVTKTILFKGIPSGLVIFYDISGEKRELRLRSLLQTVNKAITTSTHEEDLYQTLVKDIVERVEAIKCAVIGILEDSSRIEPKYSWGIDKVCYYCSGYYRKIETSRTNLKASTS